MHRSPMVAAIFGIVASACSSAPPPAPPPPQAEYILSSSIREIMLAMVAPPAETLWDSVATVSTAWGGTRDKKPTTDADWLALERTASR